MKAGRGLLTLVAILATGALCAPLAHAGSYDVYSCAIAGGLFPNNAWRIQNNLPADTRYQTKTTCSSASDPLEARLADNTTYPAGLTFAGLEFDAPSGTTISGLTFDVRHVWSVSSNQTYTLTLSSARALSGTGEFEVASQQQAGTDWYATSGAVDKRVTLTRATSASWLTVSAGCDNAGSGCSVPAGSVSLIQLYGSRVTLSDSSPPELTDLDAKSGLLAPGVRAGDEPVTFSASDNVGIRRAEIVDATDAANQSVVAATDYNTTPTAAGKRCDYTRPLPCPNVTKQTIAASPPIAGRRTLLLRVTDAAGNQTVSAPFVVTARGPVNGAGGGDGARLVAGFPGHAFRGKGKARHRIGVLRPTTTVGYGHSTRVRGILRSAAGQPVAGAELRLLVRDLRLGSHFADRGSAITGADGRFTFRFPRGASRRLRIAYRAYLGDAELTAKTDVTFNTKARITARAPGHVRARGVARFRGHLVGHPLPPRGVTIELQAHQPGHGWRTVKTTRTRKGGAYSTRYRFNSSRGSFTFRIRLRPNDSYPYARGTSKPMRVSVG